VRRKAGEEVGKIGRPFPTYLGSMSLGQAWAVGLCVFSGSSAENENEPVYYSCLPPLVSS